MLGELESRLANEESTHKDMEAYQANTIARLEHDNIKLRSMLGELEV